MITKFEIAMIIIIIIIIGFVVPHLKSTTFICSTPSISTGSYCPSNCDPICGSEHNPSCQIPECQSQKCNLEWYWMCIYK